MKKMMSVITAMVIITAMFVAPTYAQATLKAPETVTTTSSPTPQLTEVDQMRLEIVNLKFKLAQTQSQWSSCIAEKGPLQDQANQTTLNKEVQSVVEAINAAHPGFTFDPNSGQFAKKDDTKDVGAKKQ